MMTIMNNLIDHLLLQSGQHCPEEASRRQILVLVVREVMLKVWEVVQHHGIHSFD